MMLGFAGAQPNLRGRHAMIIQDGLTMGDASLCEDFALRSA